MLTFVYSVLRRNRWHWEPLPVNKTRVNDLKTCRKNLWEVNTNIWRDVKKKSKSKFSFASDLARCYRISKGDLQSSDKQTYVLNPQREKDGCLGRFCGGKVGCLEKLCIHKNKNKKQNNKTKQNKHKKTHQQTIKTNKQTNKQKQKQKQINKNKTTLQ